MDFTYIKEYPGTLSVVVKFERLTNSRYSTYPRILRANSGKLFSLKPINPEQGIGYSFSYTYIKGAIGAKISKNFTYLMPFKQASTVVVQELGNLGKNFFKKDLPREWKGYHFNSEEADTVYAVRKGVVIDVVDKYQVDNSKNYTANRNSILVEHLDGTMAHYSGFAKGGTFVKIGSSVFPHTPIGTLSGGLDKGKLYFYIYFMAKPNKYERAKDPDEIAVEQFVTPIFATDKGNNPLTPGKKYSVVKEESLITSEMSKREKKRFKSGALK